MADTTAALLARLDERTESMAKDLDQVKHVLLEGNGSPPMTVQVATMYARIVNLEEDKKEAKIPRSITIGLVVSIVLAISGMLVGFAQ